MHVLVADRDRRFLELIRGVVEGEGHRVVVADEGARAIAQLGAHLPELLVLEHELQRPGGAAVLRHLRALPGGDAVRVVLTTPGRTSGVPELDALVRECRVDHVLRKPFPMFDLVDLLRDLHLDDEDDQPPASPFAPRTPPVRPVVPATARRARLSEIDSPPGPAYTMLPVHAGNVRQVAALWARRRSGRLRLLGGPGGAAGWLLLGEGGPLDSDGWELVSAALHGGRVEFDGAVAAPGPGDHLGLGAMLFGRIRDPDGPAFVETHRFDALRAVRHPNLLAALPLAEPTRQVLARASASALLGELAAAFDGARPAIDADLAALDLLGLIELGPPEVRRDDSQPSRGASRPPGRALPSRPPASRAPRDPAGSVSASHSPRDPASTASASRSETRGSIRERLEARRRERESVSQGFDEDSVTRLDPEPGRARRAGTDSSPPSTPTSPSGSQPPSSVTDSAMQSKPGDWARVRRRMAHRGREWTTRQVARQTSREREQRVERLHKEVERLADAPPAVVLGIPSDADLPLVEEATARMRSRYQELMQDPQLGAEGRELAGRVLALVEAARQGWGQRRSAHPAHADQGDVEKLVAAGRRAVGEEDWHTALHWLRRARDLDFGHAPALALLGWATLHDEELDGAEREEEARGLLFLAAEIDRRDADANFYLARFLADRGEVKQAAACAARALQATPDDRLVQALVARIRKQLEPG